MPQRHMVPFWKSFPPTDMTKREHLQDVFGLWERKFQRSIHHFSVALVPPILLLAFLVLVAGYPSIITVAFSQVDDTNFDRVIEFDNKCFVSRDFKPRRDFLRKWTQISGGASYIALSSSEAGDDGKGKVVGFGCRRPAIQSANHVIGPIYAESKGVAGAILNKLLVGIAGDKATIDIWWGRLCNGFDIISLVTIPKKDQIFAARQSNNF